jgi:hypothetical protein
LQASLQLGRPFDDPAVRPLLRDVRVDPGILISSIVTHTATIKELARSDKIQLAQECWKTGQIREGPKAA